MLNKMQQEKIEQEQKTLFEFLEYASKQSD